MQLLVEVWDDNDEALTKGRIDSTSKINILGLEGVQLRKKESTLWCEGIFG